MKKAILIALSVLAANTAAVAHAGERSLTVVFAGGGSADTIAIAVSPDGRSYVIDSATPLEVGGTVCTHPAENPDQLVCEAAPIAGFEVNAGSGDDVVSLGREVPIPATLRGGPGNDKLLGGAAADKLLGGSGDDTLVGRAGDDWLYGGTGDDRLVGGSGNDLLRGGSGQNTMIGGSGQNDIAARVFARR
jgi:Ca2+-binding RTX toxin-like protein